MSAWDHQPRATVVPIRGRKKNVNQVIIPHVVLTDNLATFEDDLEKLRTNNGQYRAAIEHLLGSDAGDILGVTPVLRNDSSIAYLELRVAQKSPHKNVAPKTFRIIYRADVSGSDNPKDDGLNRLCVGIEALASHELLIPTNSRAMLDAVSEFKSNRTDNLRPAFLWCEGEKARLGLQRRIESSHALEAFAAKGFFPVTAATLSGMPGVVHTNYALMPQPRVAARYLVEGKNDTTLDLSVPFHFIIPDNDNIGYNEACALADRFITFYKVPATQVLISESPPSARLGWDDADELPPFFSEEDRISQILEASAYIDRWVLRPTKNSVEIDPTHMANRRRALKLAGISESYVDTASSQIVIKSPLRWQNKSVPDDTELMLLAEVALAKMGHLPTLNLLQVQQWRDTLNSMYSGVWRDSIHEETMATIEAGREQKTEANRPERLFCEMFGLPDVPFVRQAGWHMIRDTLALRLRPAFNAEAVIPQLLFVFYGNEGCGKSTAVKVLAGGSPAPLQDAPRYTDKLDLRDLPGSDTHGDLQLYHKIAGMTAVELADKSLGVDVSRSRADMLKHFANKGSLQYRTMFGRTPSRCNLRSIRIFTTNNSDILTPDMGSRRWVIVDTTKTLWPDPATILQRAAAENRELTPFETARLQQHNPGLDWVYVNLPAMLSHMYDSDAWRGDLHPTPEFAAMLESSQVDYVSEENWELIFGEELSRFEAYPATGVLPAQLARYSQDTFTGGRAPSPQAMGAVMRRRGWQASPQRIGPKPMRVWHRCAKASQVDRYAVWAHKDGGSPGKWVIQSNPSDAATEAMEKAADDLPF